MSASGLPHVGDDAELYALGLLGAEERVAIEDHIAQCADCLRRVGEAEESAAALASTLPVQAQATPALTAAGRSSQRVARVPATWWTGAAAAAFALALGGSLAQNAALRGEVRDEEAATAGLVASHFLHVPLSASAGSALRAKVLYARDGGWIYLVATGMPAGTHVVERTPNGERDLGVPVTTGATASLFVGDAGHPTSVALVRGGIPLAAAKITYAAGI